MCYDSYQSPDCPCKPLLTGPQIFLDWTQHVSTDTLSLEVFSSDGVNLIGSIFIRWYELE
jgi:hypothetical protein